MSQQINIPDGTDPRVGQQITNFADRANKLRKKIESIKDPYDDLLEVLNVLQSIVSIILNNVLKENAGLKAINDALESEKKVLEAELDTLKKKKKKTT